MHVLQNIRPNNSMQISLHEIKHQIDILVVLRFYQVQQFDYVRMSIQLLKENDLRFYFFNNT